MFRTRVWRYALFAFLLYVTLCTVGGIYLADGALHPPRRPLGVEESIAAQDIAKKLDASFIDESISTPDAVTLRAWLIIPNHYNHDAVILLHGVGDNRLGMMGYAQLFLSHGYMVLLPDARAQGTSGGEVATYGLLERNDIHQWADFLDSIGPQIHPHCIYGFGESMGAAQLLQSLQTRPHFCAVVAESPFATFREIAYDRMGQPFHTGRWVGKTVLRPLVEIAFLRARWKYHVDMQQASPVDSLLMSNVPVLLIHGQDDSNIPLRHSLLIHKKCPRTKLWEVPGADHCGALSVAPKEFETRVLNWFQTAAPASTPAVAGATRPQS